MVDIIPLPRTYLMASFDSFPRKLSGFSKGKQKKNLAKLISSLEKYTMAAFYNVLL